MALLVRLLIVVAVLALVPFVAVGGLIAIDGLSGTAAHAVSPDGSREALAERQGGSMQFPITTLSVHRRGGWLSADGPDCVVARWSDKGRPARPVTLRWIAADMLALGGNGAPDTPQFACGITLVAQR
ncbi:hypothetical protein M9979_05460 [Sphingomonas sp. RP10(2022)]|uniref:Uncharacterized protein n=1 Tax=Sphingomonas liriopis TaxID=2949094 RepID=A0A9X2HYD6_9SPHN|nr:hypothetical protein [Sphingomonas liriopis]MCP3734325.1 hypothetical protein [Sphingomonas liriopis]